MTSWLERRPRAVVASALGAWALLACLLITRTPAGAFSHDFQGHVQHTRILYNQKRLAYPREGGETYQPPLYYMLNTLFLPNKPSHTFWVRLMSVLYGLLTLLLMVRFLSRLHISHSAQLMVLSFVATTPAFLFMFSTYNNDSLATLLSIALMMTLYEWMIQGKRPWIIGFGLLSVVALYTKLSVAFLLGPLCAILGVLAWFRAMRWERVRAVFFAVGVGVLSLGPWLIRNYRYSGYFTPSSADFPVDDRIHLSKTPFRTVFTLEGWSPSEWKDPYAHLWEGTHHKKNSFIAYVFTTSLFSEYTFEGFPQALPWAIALVHAILWMSALALAYRTKISRFSVGLLVLGAAALTSLIFRSAYASLMDFRYIAWAWLPEAVLYTTTLIPRNSEKSPSSKIFPALFISGAIVQSIFWFFLVVGGRWNIP